MIFGSTTIIIDYQNINGYHFFTSEDVEGLHVGSSDLEKAYGDVPSAVKLLMRLNHGITNLELRFVPCETK